MSDVICEGIKEDERIKLLNIDQEKIFNRLKEIYPIYLEYIKLNNDLKKLGFQIIEKSY